MGQGQQKPTISI